MEECIDSLVEAIIFSSFDFNSGYWQIDLDEHDRDKTALCSHFGLYLSTRMPFGLSNAPRTFQLTDNVIPSSFNWQSALVYLYDVIVYSNTVEEHHEHVHIVFQLLHDAGVTLQLRKFVFFQDSIDYLGRIVRPDRLSVVSKTCDAVQQAGPPTTQTEILSFLCLYNIYRRFLPSFARIASPLNSNI